MASVGEVLSRYGISATEADIAAVLEDAFQQMPVAAAAAPAADTVDYLARHGGATAAAAVAAWDPDDEHQRRQQTVATAAAQVAASTLSVAEVADQLGVDSSRIRHLITDQPPGLYAVTVGGRRGIPAWQIYPGGLLPGLDQVVARIPASVHPLDVAAVMTTPQDEVAGRTPVDHLAGGGDPELVGRLVADLARW